MPIEIGGTVNALSVSPDGTWAGLAPVSAPGQNLSGAL